MTPETLSAVANHLWQSTLFAAAAALLAFILRKNRAAVRHWIWLAASVKFLIPFSLLVSVGSHFQWRTISTIAKPAVVDTVKGISQPFTFKNSKSDEIAAYWVAAPTSRSLIPFNRLSTVLISLWLCGVAAVAFSWLREWRRLRQAVRTAWASPLNMPIKALTSSVCLEPGVVGIFRPVLLLPEGITERLTAGQLEAILIHELCHVRRRDNLAAAIHMFVETLFWFHPLVWWLERRLVAERERACDEEVLRVVGEPEAYAEGILNVCKFYRESPLVCMSGVTGSNLKNRIEEIMMNRVIQKLGLGRTMLLAAAALAAIAVPVAFGMVQASQNETASAPVAEPVQSSTNPIGEPQTSEEQKQSEGWLDRIEAAGFRNLSVDQLIRLKEHDIDVDYIRQVRAMGFDLDVDTLIRFREHDINTDYINELKQVGLRDLDANELVRLREHDAQPAWIRQIQSMGYSDVSADDIIRLLEHDVTPEYVRQAQSRFKGITVDELVRVKEHDILRVR